jgi:signal transduction histidine kinase
MGGIELEIFFGALSFFITTSVAFFIYLKNPTSATNRLFFWLSFVVDLYIVINFFSLHPLMPVPDEQLFWIRFVMFVTSFIGPILVLLVQTFPEQKLVLNLKYTWPMFLLMSASAIFAFTPLIFQGISYSNGQVNPIPGNGIIVFVLDFAGLFLLSFILLFIKYRRATDLKKIQLGYFFYGILFSFSLMVLTNVVFVLILKISSLVFLGPMYPVILMLAVAYAIVKHKMFDIKVVTTQVFVTLLQAILFAKIFIFAGLFEMIGNIFIFGSTLFFGGFLVRSVEREVAQREKIEKIADDLSVANEHLRVLDKQKSDFVSIASHQLRTPVTAITGYSSMLIEGTYGALPVNVIEVLGKVYQSSRNLAVIIDDFLTISHIEQGKMTYKFETVEMKKMIDALVDEFRPAANNKGLFIHFTTDGYEEYNITGDFGKIRQVLSNLVDNAIKYTISGGVEIHITKDFTFHKTRIMVKDTGIGLSEESISALFQKFSRAKEVQKVYTDGSGIGLYIGQELVKAHHGRIWVESEGEGKGASFFVELLSEE